VGLACSGDSIGEDGDVEALEQVLDGGSNLVVVDLLLGGQLVVDAVELEAESLGLVLGQPRRLCPSPAPA
jgi:hypothetical protein